MAVLRRSTVVATVLVAVTAAGAVRASTALPPPIAAHSVYVVRPDPRACPSPLCGGYWVALANHARTRCPDGFFRTFCYVASVNAVSTRKPLPTSLPGNALVQADLGSQAFGDFGELGALFVSVVWSPVGSAPASGRYFRLRDTGIRCVRAPCFSFRANRLNTRAHTTVSSVDLGPARETDETLRRAEAALRSPQGLRVAGRISASADGGRLFRASQVYLKTAPPHA
jgi:hypothetical protein